MTTADIINMMNIQNSFERIRTILGVKSFRNSLFLLLAVRTMVQRDVVYFNRKEKTST